jgi:UDP-N-acetyl-D-mannosaminuronic acid dehydrogenase
VAVVGLGYVGLTLAVGFALAGLEVIGCERDARRRGELERGSAPFHEPGLQEALAQLRPEQLAFAAELPDPLPPAIVLCVGTPVDPMTREPRLGDLAASLAEVLPLVTDGTLVVVRSTVPVGTTREAVLDPLRERLDEPLVAYCPERTIQGQALAELAGLPQVIGGAPTARRRAAALFGQLTGQIVEVSSLEAAELVKLVNNAHTDLIYGFGNEVAMIAGSIGIDADEVIDAANEGYPRPNLSRPGYVGGSCLIKDPYLLLASARSRGYDAGMVAAARAVNEHVPVHVAERVLGKLEAAGADPGDLTVLVSGIAYKGTPETDDVRGSAIEGVVEVLLPRVGQLLGHDFVVGDETIARLGLEPCELTEGCSRASALIVLNNHSGYADQSLTALLDRMHPPRVVYDLWGVFRGQARPTAAGVYLRLGHEP